MPIVLPQQLLSLLVRNHTQILSSLNILPKVPPGLKLPKSRQELIIAVRLRERKDPIPVARWIDERRHVELRIVGNVDEVLRRELREGFVLAGVAAHEPVGGAVARFAEAGAEVGIGQDGGDLEGWGGGFHGGPDGFFGGGLAGGVDVCYGLEIMLGDCMVGNLGIELTVRIRRRVGAESLEHGFVPGVFGYDCLLVGDRRKCCCA